MTNVMCVICGMMIGTMLVSRRIDIITCAMTGFLVGAPAAAQPNYYYRGPNGMPTLYTPPPTPEQQAAEQQRVQINADNERARVKNEKWVKDQYTSALIEGYDRISIDDFILDAKTSIGRHVVIPGYYSQSGEVDVLLANQYTAYQPGSTKDMIPLLTEDAPRDIRQFMRDCVKQSNGIASCETAIKGVIGECTITSTFGATREKPCLKVEGGWWWVRK